MWGWSTNISLFINCREILTDKLGVWVATIGCLMSPRSFSSPGVALARGTFATPWVEINLSALEAEFCLASSFALRAISLEMGTTTSPANLVPGPCPRSFRARCFEVPNLAQRGLRAKSAGSRQSFLDVLAELVDGCQNRVNPWRVSQGTFISQHPNFHRE